MRQSELRNVIGVFTSLHKLRSLIHLEIWSCVFDLREYLNDEVGRTFE